MTEGRLGPAYTQGFADGRFVARRLLGRGAFGSVYEVHEPSTGARLALKLLDREQPWALYRFKAEFRSLVELHHQNLVTLYELHHEPATERWFFTMELVEGVDPLMALAARVVEEGSTDATRTGGTEDGPLEEDDARPDAAADAPAGDLKNAEPAEVRAVFAQIAAGIAALHDAGLLHRDLKPSNVLVDRSGTVKLLDFGLVALLEHEAERRRPAGTPNYMAPELLAGGRASEASDWFGLGVILHQALTGRLPPRPERGELLADERGPLPELCRALLHDDPEQRPSAPEILSVFGLDGSSSRPVIGRRKLFVGREPELAALAQAFAASHRGPMFALVLGTSGIGKSALVRHFLAEREEEGALVASGRCFQQEVVPLKAIDGVVDSLSRVLRHEGASGRGGVPELPPEWASALVRLFPVIGVVLEPREAVRFEGEPHDLRRRAVEGLVGLLEQLAARRPLIIDIDDLQWGDVASAELLAELLRRGFPVLLVATCRSEEEADSAFLRELEGFTRHRPDRFVRVELERLHDEHCRALVSLLLEGDPASSPRTAAVARESGGNPFFIEQLVRHGAAPGGGGVASLHEVVARRLDGLTGDERELIELIAVAGQPTRREIVLSAADGEHGWQALEALRRLRLIRSRDRESEIESYHDRIRESLLSALSPARRARWARRLADAMVTHEFRDRGRIAQHYVEAGDGELAVPHAIAAAELAREGLAFERAAQLYRLAAEQLPPDAEPRFELLERCADALVQGGHGAEAAELYETIAATRTEPEAMLQRAAEQWMSSGHHDRGTALLRELALGARLRWPTGEGRAVALAMLGLARLRLRRIRFDADAKASVEAVRQLELCFVAYRGLAAHDVARALYYVVEACQRCLRCGDGYYAAQTLVQAGGYLRAAGLRGIGERIHAEGLRLAADHDEPYLRGLIDLYEGYPRLSLGQLHETIEIFDRSLATFEEQCTGTAWEVAMVRAMQCDNLYTLGEYRRLYEYARASYERGRSLGDSQAIIGGGLYLGAAHAARGELSDARRHVAEALGHVDDDALFSYPRGTATIVSCMCDLYEGRRVEALRRFEDAWPRFRRSGLYWSAMIRGRMLVVRAAILTSLVDAAGPREIEGFESFAAWRRALCRCAKAMGKVQQGWVDAEAARLEAVLAAHEGDRARALGRLEHAEATFAAERFSLKARTCALHRAQLLGEREHVERGLEDLAAAGVREPSRWLLAYSPGFCGGFRGELGER